MSNQPNPENQTNKISKEERLKLIASLATKIKVKEKLASTEIKQRGRPKKDVVKEIEDKGTESFDYAKLSDDAGVIHTKEEDVKDELKLMGTWI